MNHVTMNIYTEISNPWTLEKYVLPTSTLANINFYTPKNYPVLNVCPTNEILNKYVSRSSNIGSYI